jgi:hypothetical protein
MLMGKVKYIHPLFQVRLVSTSPLIMIFLTFSVLKLHHIYSTSCHPLLIVDCHVVASPSSLVLVANDFLIKPRNSSNPRDANGSRIYHVMMQHMQLLPCTKYTQSACVDTLKGKRKAVDVGEAIGQSSTKKGPFTAGHEEDGMGLESRGYRGVD